MCGILGILQSKPCNGRELREMAHLLRHRGPDDEGFLVATKDQYRIYGGADTPRAVFESDADFAPKETLEDMPETQGGSVAFGHRRLSIVDLSPRGHQPMNLGDRYWITFNGEIYNHIELRQELSSSGVCFSSSSDTEVILAAYAKWGVQCLSKFNGMWGLAILDRVAGTLFLARDRFGIKPLYYRVAHGRFAFASEIKAFTAMSDWAASINMERFMDFLVWGIIDHTSESMFRDVQQLAAGHYILLDTTAFTEAGQEPNTTPHIQAIRWYFLPTAESNESVGHEAELLSLIDDAIRLRLRADVPVGSCLSGGLDSSAIVCLMSRQLAQAGVVGTLKTFTSRSPDPMFDESEYASAVISQSGASGSYITPTPEVLFENLDRLIWHQDSPLISGSTIAQWMIFQAARASGVVVMLDGQGADEILCGYRGFFGAYLAGLIAKGQVFEWISAVRSLHRESDFSPLRSVGYTAAYLRPEIVGWLGRFDRRPYSDRGWLTSKYQWAYDADPIRTRGGRSSTVRMMSIAQVESTNLPMLLHWEDRNSMAFSVEARVPFLDYRVVELCLRMPAAAKLGSGLSKTVLRNCMRGIVPEKILNRRDKMGFVTSEPLWTTGKLSPQFRRGLVDAVEAMPTILDPSILTRFDQVVAGTRAFDYRYWRAISAARWAKLFSVSLQVIT